MSRKGPKEGNALGLEPQGGRNKALLMSPNSLALAGRQSMAVRTGAARDPILDIALDSHSWSPMWSTGSVASTQHKFSHLERQSLHGWSRENRFRFMTTHTKDFLPLEKRVDDAVHRKEPKQLIASKWQTPRKPEHQRVRRTSLTERIKRDCVEKMYTGRSDLTDHLPDTPDPLDFVEF